MDIRNTEEAFNLYDEIVVYKSAVIFEYFNNLNPKQFQAFLNKLFNTSNSTLDESCLTKKTQEIFNKHRFLAILDAANLVLLRGNPSSAINKNESDALELKVSEIFGILTRNKGIIKIEIVRFLLFNP